MTPITVRNNISDPRVASSLKLQEPCDETFLSVTGRSIKIKKN